MGTEKVALGLDQIGWQALGAKCVKIGERRAKAHTRDAVADERRNRFSQGNAMLPEKFCNFLVQQKARQGAIAGIRAADLLEPGGTDYTAAAPYFRGFSEVKPIFLF